MADVGVIGAGVAGLTAAYQLQQAGRDVQVLEASERIGGKIQTEQTGGYLVELGPNSLRGSGEVLRSIIEGLDLEGDVVEARDTASNRYVVRDSTPRPLPSSLRSFLTTDLLSTSAKVRLLGEPFVASKGESETDESVASFVRRRLGPEVLRYVVDPFVGGIFAGDPHKLSLRNAFESLHDLEANHGSLARGLLHRVWNRSSTGSGSRRGVFSFRDGLQTLPAALADALGDRVQTNAPVTALRQDDTRWHVATRTPDGATQMHFFDAVICTVPLPQLSEMDLNTSLGRGVFDEVPYPPVSVLALGFQAEDVDHPLDGFGMLVPKAEEELRILGTIFSSSLFPGRAPDGHVLLTTFVGGMREPELGGLSTSSLRPIVESDLQALLGVHGSPTFVRHRTWDQAIPQYTQGYDQVKHALQELENEYPGLFFAGNYRQGISVSDAMESAAQAAERVQHTLDAMVRPS